jgi:WD40 repeat protein/serine/threonine protein kinase
VGESSPLHSKIDARHLARVLEDVRKRRAGGETLSDEAVLDAYPELGPQLAIELRKLGVIQRARRLADSRVLTLTADERAAASAATQLAPDSIPGYEVLGEIHRGGQGVVYHAIQNSTQREVAIKVMREGPFAGAYDRMRFEREVRVLSAMKHPNIVSIHDSGIAAGLTYFVMNYIAGEPLDTFVAKTRCGVDAVLRLFVKICDAVNAAQLCGVIHRDLKPGNIRIDDRGEPHVLDFGLAKIDRQSPVPSSPSADPSFQAPVPSPQAGVPRFQSPVESGRSSGPSSGDWQLETGNYTETGQFVGSLPWASPEQAEGAPSEVDVRTDVYSLGVILFQALTGLFPYPVGGGLQTVLDNIQNAVPIRPSAIRREINDEVETIVLKCLQKDRQRRYQNAGELSRDVQRYLRGEPIDAKRDSTLYVLRKQLRRYRVPVVAALAVFVSLIAGIIGTTRATWRAQRAEAEAEARAGEEFRLRERADWESYKACLTAADAALGANDTVTAKARLDASPARLRGWEWQQLASRLDQSLASYPVAGEIISRCAISPDGSVVILPLSKGGLSEVDARTGQSVRTITPPGPDVTAIEFSNDGSRMALGLRSGEIIVRSLKDDREVVRFQAGPVGAIAALAFGPDATLLASASVPGSGPNSIQVWKAESGEAFGTIEETEAGITSMAFRPDGRVLVSGHMKPHAGFRMWDVETWRELHSVDFVGQDVYDVRFDPSGRVLAVASQESSIKLYDAESGVEVRKLAGHSASVRGIAFDAAGRRLASASADQTVRVWDVDSGASLSCRRGHLNAVTQVAFLPGDSGLVSISVAESMIKLWDEQQDEEPLTFDTGKYFVFFLAFSADGRRLFTHQRCWDSDTWQEIAQLAGRKEWDGNVWVYPDSSVEWASNSPRQAEFAFYRNGRPVLRITEPVAGPIVSSDGGEFALGLPRGAWRIFRADDGRLVREIAVDAKSAKRAKFSHDSRKLLAWTSDGHWTIWEVETGRELLSGVHGSDQLVNAVFSFDDRLIATASYDGAARICDAQTGRELHVLRPSGAPTGDQAVVWSVAFSPDGTRLATGSKDRRIRIWDVATGQELAALTKHAGTVMSLSWSPDGKQLASGGYDGTVCIWDSLRRAERRARANAFGKLDSIPRSIRKSD